MGDLFKPKKEKIKPEDLKNKKRISILEQMIQKGTRRNPLFKAIEELKDKDEIQQFYQEYIEYLQENARKPDIAQNPEKYANKTIKYILEQYSLDKKARWEDALEDYLK